MDILEFISANTQLFSVAIAALAGFSAFVKWVDSRNRELKEARYTKYMNLIGVISGKRDDGQRPAGTEQIASVWFLLEYKEYSHVTKMIFSNSDFTKFADKTWIENVYPHVQSMLKEI